MKNRMIILVGLLGMSMSAYSINFARFAQLKSLAARAAHVTCSYVKEHKLASGAVATATLIALIPSARRLAVAAWQQGAAWVKSAASTLMRWWKPAPKDTADAQNAPQVRPAEAEIAASAQENAAPAQEIRHEDVQGELDDLHRAIERNDNRLVEALLTEGANIEAECNGLRPLARAIDKGNAQIVELLCKRGANKEESSECRKREKTFVAPHLYRAILKKDPEIVNILCSNGVDVNQVLEDKDQDGSPYTHFTPLIFAVVSGQHEMVRILCEYGAKLEDQGQIEDQGPLMTPLQLAAQCRQHKDLVKREAALVTGRILVQAGAKLDGVGQLFFRELVGGAIQAHDVTTVTAFVRSGGSLPVDIIGRAFMASPKADDDVKFLESLMEKYKAPFVKLLVVTDSGETLLHLAVQKDSFNAAQYLLQNGAQVMARDRFNKLPADYAKSSKMEELLADHMKCAVSANTL